MSLVFIMVLLLLCGCSTPKSTDQSSETEIVRMEGKQPENLPVDTTACSDLTCLKAHEGEMIDVVGWFVFPKQAAFAVNRLKLRDGTTIVLSPPQHGRRIRFAEEHDGLYMRIHGRIYTGEIPDEYHIIGRTSEPHLVDMVSSEYIGGQEGR